ncbi:MAG: VWA domain-containing protein, partial [bacterium]|nr:VWA domain-containing protein [bacterium]
KINVTAAAAGLDCPASVPAGSSFQVKWTGPDNKSDYITITPEDAPDNQYLSYAYTNKGSPGKLTAPDKPGAHEVRYVMGQSRKVLARVKISVTAVTAGLDCPASVPAGSSFQVKWTGPDNKSDYITIAAKDAADRNYLSYAYTSRGSPATLTAPDKTGVFQVRYVMNQSRTVIARRDITLTAITAKVSAPASVAGESKFQVSWQGPNYKRDYITIAEAGAPDKTYLSYAYTSRGLPSSLKAPAKPGKYEVRYVLGQSKRVLARAPVIVK